jgi:hypothetical protein
VQEEDDLPDEDVHVEHAKAQTIFVFEGRKEEEGRVFGLHQLVLVGIVHFDFHGVPI